MFTDLKRNESHSGRSRSIVFDHRDELARLVKAVLTNVPVFTDLTEMARSTISNRSTKLFTFSGLYHATVILLSDRKQDPFGSRLTLATDFWLEVAKNVPDWSRASENKVTTAELRRGYVHAHALALAALARVGKSLIAKHPSDWRRRLHPSRHTGLVPIERSAMGRSSDDRRPHIQGSNMRDSHWQRDQEAPWIAARSRRGGGGESLEGRLSLLSKGARVASSIMCVVPESSASDAKQGGLGSAKSTDHSAIVSFARHTPIGPFDRGLISTKCPLATTT